MPHVPAPGPCSAAGQGRNLRFAVDEHQRKRMSLMIPIQNLFDHDISFCLLFIQFVDHSSFVTGSVDRTAGLHQDLRAASGEPHRVCSWKSQGYPGAEGLVVSQSCCPVKSCCFFLVAIYSYLVGISVPSNFLWIFD